MKAPQVPVMVIVETQAAIEFARAGVARLRVGQQNLAPIRAGGRGDGQRRLGPESSPTIRGMMSAGPESVMGIPVNN